MRLHVGAVFQAISWFETTMAWLKDMAAPDRNYLEQAANAYFAPIVLKKSALGIDVRCRDATLCRKVFLHSKVELGSCAVDARAAASITRSVNRPDVLKRALIC